MNNNSRYIVRERFSSMHNAKAFTLIEMIIFIVVFSVGVVGIMVLFFNVLDKTSDPALRIRGVQVAQAVMEDVMSKKWDELTPNGGCADYAVDCSVAASTIGPNEGSDCSDIDNYDDVDDYDGVDCASEDYGGTGLGAGYQIEIDVQYGNLSGTTMSDGGTVKSNYKIIDVVVTSGVLDESYHLQSVKGNF